MCFFSFFSTRGIAILEVLGQIGQIPRMGGWEEGLLLLGSFCCRIQLLCFNFLDNSCHYCRIVCMLSVKIRSSANGFDVHLQFSFSKFRSLRTVDLTLLYIPPLRWRRIGKSSSATKIIWMNTLICVPCILNSLPGVEIYKVVNTHPLEMGFSALCISIMIWVRRGQYKLKTMQA